MCVINYIMHTFFCNFHAITTISATSCTDIMENCLPLSAVMGREKVFRFKQFAVVNDRTAMKVGTDGVLLGAWCPVDSAKRVLDVGTGCGVIALMIAQRNATAIIDGIDIDQDAIEEATVNFANSPWGNRLNASLADFNDLTGCDHYDLIVSNPPYFTEGVLPPDASRTLARHTRSLSYRQLIEGATRLLTKDGMLCLISPTDAESDIIEAATFSSLPIRRLTRVIPIEGAEPKRTLWQLSHRPMPYSEDTLTIARADGSFTEEYIDYTGAFYLKM